MTLDEIAEAGWRIAEAGAIDRPMVQIDVSNVPVGTRLFQILNADDEIVALVFVAADEPEVLNPATLISAAPKMYCVCARAGGDLHSLAVSQYEKGEPLPPEVAYYAGRLHGACLTAEAGDGVDYGVASAPRQPEGGGS